MKRLGILMVCGVVVGLSLACGSGSDNNSEPIDGDSDSVADGDSDSSVDGDSDSAEGDSESQPAIPDHLEVTYSRPDSGTAIPAADITAFTKKLAAFWKKVNYYKWVGDISYGQDKSTGKPDWMLWWGDAAATKAGNLVTFAAPGADGGGHNVWIDSSKVLASSISAYLLTGDSNAAYVAAQYAKGLTAMMKGMEFGANDPDKYIMARNIVTQDQSFTLSDGRQKATEYHGWYTAYDKWNTSRFENKDNPYWGDIWVTNKRSKDDVCHILRMTAFLRYAVEYAKDADLKAAATEAYSYMEGFAKDIVDHEYNIRTKDSTGKTYILTGQNADLANFHTWDVLFGDNAPNPECTAKVASDLIAYGAPKEGDTACYNNGTYNDFETYAIQQNAYNLAIVRNFHMAAIDNALLHRQNDLALALLQGLGDRVNKDQDASFTMDVKSHDDWQGQMAVFLLQSASVGLPLTSAEVAIVKAQYEQAITEYSAYDKWDLWSLADGTYSSRPDTGAAQIAIEEMGLAFEYCYSPFRNPAGVAPIDCDVVRDPTQWGK